MRQARAAAVCLVALLAAAFPPATAAAQEAAERGAGAVLRGVDKMDGTVADIALANGDSAVLGGLTLELGECRYPQDEPARDAYAFLTIRDSASGAVLFSGWMIASSPALNALEHWRYDVWVLRCRTE